MRAYIPVCHIRDDNGNTRDQLIWSMGQNQSDFSSKAAAELYFAQFAEAWEETYADLGMEMLSLRVAEFQEV